MPTTGVPRSAGRLEEVAGQHAKAAGVQRQRFVQAEFHAEVGNAWESLGARRPPGGSCPVTRPRFLERAQIAQEVRVTGEPLQPLERNVLQ